MGYKKVVEEFRDRYDLYDYKWNGTNPSILELALFYKETYKVAKCLNDGKDVALVNVPYNDVGGNELIKSFTIIEDYDG